MNSDILNNVNISTCKNKNAMKPVKGLIENNCHVPHLVQAMLGKNGGFNLFLLLAKPPAYMSKLKKLLKMTALYDKNIVKINAGTFRTEKKHQLLI